jgi:quinone-modifying oxidoreductase subunit QmoC
MAAALLVKPDTDFLQAVLSSGGEDLKKCFQCATCSAVCELSPEGAPFPRRQMLEAQWGLKDKVLKDPAIWLCHHCGRCTTYCPRGARPGDVLNALRREVIKGFAYPAFLGRTVASPRLWPVLFLVPALIFAAILLWAPKGPPTAELEFANAFPIPVLEALFFAVAGLVVVAFAVSMWRFIQAMRAPGTGGIMPGLLPALGLIATHERFAKCSGGRSRYWGHLLTLWGFVGLALVGTIVGVGNMFGVMHTPLLWFHPAKLFANLCAAVILAGLALLLADRIADPRNRAASTYYDWFFLLTIGGVAVTGVVSELLRLAQLRVMYAVYFVHLVLIFALFLYAPYSKFAHLVYRTVAIAAAKAAERRPRPADAAVPGAGGAVCATCRTGSSLQQERRTCS